MQIWHVFHLLIQEIFIKHLPWPHHYDNYNQKCSYFVIYIFYFLKPDKWSVTENKATLNETCMSVLFTWSSNAYI